MLFDLHDLYFISKMDGDNFLFMSNTFHDDFSVLCQTLYVMTYFRDDILSDRRSSFKKNRVVGDIIRVLIFLSLPGNDFLPETFQFTPVAPVPAKDGCC